MDNTMDNTEENLLKEFRNKEKYTVIIGGWKNEREMEKVEKENYTLEKFTDRVALVSESKDGSRTVIAFSSIGSDSMEGAPIEPTCYISIRKIAPRRNKTLSDKLRRYFPQKEEILFDERMGDYSYLTTLLRRGVKGGFKIPENLDRVFKAAAQVILEESDRRKKIKEMNEEKKIENVVQQFKSHSR